MAEHYARHAMSMINEATEVDIPADQRLYFLAEGSFNLARAIFALAQAGGILPAEKQKAGEEAIELAREALKIFTRMHGTESAKVAMSMSALAAALNYFNNVDDDEFTRLRQQSIAIYRRVEGSSSVNVAVGENNLGIAYQSRAQRAEAANDLDRYLVNLELALPHFRESARIYRAVNHVDRADEALRNIAQTEENIRQNRITKAASPTTKG